MVSIIPAGGDRQSVLYQNRMEQVKSPILGTQATNYSKNSRSYTDTNNTNNFQQTTGYLQNQSRNIQNSNVQGTTRASRLHNPNHNLESLQGDMKSAHSRSASMPEAVYLKVHHHKQQTAVVPPNHFQPLELPHQQKLHESSAPASNIYTQRLVPAQLSLAHPTPQSISKPMLPHLTHYYGPFVKVHPKPYPSSNYSQNSIYGPLPVQSQHPAVGLRRSHTNAGDYLGRRREAKLSTFNSKTNASPTSRALSPHLQPSSGLLNRGSYIAEQTDHVMNLDGSIQNIPRLMYGLGRPSAGLARSRSNIAAIGGASGLPYNQHRPDRDSMIQPTINLRPHHIGRRSNLARATSFYHPSAAGSKIVGSEAFAMPHAGHMRSSSMLASLSSGIPPNFGEKSTGSSRKILTKDICKPLHVDCSIEYDLGNQPKIPKDSAPLLIIHPAYHNMKNRNEDHSPRYHPYTEGKDSDNSGKRYPFKEEAKKLTRSAPPKTNKYQQHNQQQRHGRGITRHSSFAYSSSSGHVPRKLMPLNLENEFHSDLPVDHAVGKKGSSLAYSRSSSNLRNPHNINRRAPFDNLSAASKQLKWEARYYKENDKTSLDREKESVHLSMLDITLEKEQEVQKDEFYINDQIFHEKNGAKKGASVVRRGTSVTASSKPEFPRDLRKNHVQAINIHSSKSKQHPKAKAHINGKLAAARKSSTGSRDSGAASSLEADSSGGFNSFLSTMTVVSSLGSSGIGESKRDMSLSNKESMSPSPELDSIDEKNRIRLKYTENGIHAVNSVNTPYRDEAKINFDNKAVTKIRIFNQDDTHVIPNASNNMPISTTNVKMIQNRFTQQVQNLSNNFCDSGLGTPSSLNDTKSANGRNNGNNLVSTTPNGQLSSSVIGKLSNASSTQNSDSSKPSLGISMKSYLNSSLSSSSSSNKWKSSMSGLVNGFLCCSMRHRHNSYSSSSASSPNIELQGYTEPRPLGCKPENQRTNMDNQPLRNYFVNSIPVSPKDNRTVEAQLASYNWPNNQNERNGISRNPSFLMEKSSEFNSVTGPKPSSSITVIPPQGGNWNAVLSNPNYSQHKTICENPSQGHDLRGKVIQDEGANATHNDHMTRRSPWINTFAENTDRRELNCISDPKIRISSPSMSTSNTSSGEGLGSSVMSSGSSTSNPSSLSQSTGNFAKHNVLIENRSDSSSSSTSSSSSLSSSSGTADFTPPNNFNRDSMAGRGFNSSKNTESRKVGSNQDASYQEKMPVSYFIDDDNMNDNSKPSQERFAAYYWNGNNDDNEIYSSTLNNEAKAKRNSGMLMPSGMIKEEQRNPNYSSPPVPSASSQQSNLHNLTMNANFMRPIHI